MVNGKRGFTLVEILVAITIIATLIVAAVATLNPRGQVNKAQDAVRTQNINSIKLALDLYYNDKNCYPALAGSPFLTALSSGGQWKEGTTVYMKKVPKDPSSNIFYTYKTDETVCPQWGVVFAKLSAIQTLATACPLSAKSECVPQGFDNSWACVTSGIINCSVLLTSRLGLTGSTAPTPTPTLTTTLALTPTQTPVSDQDFFVAQPGGTNPQFYQGTISPLFQAIGKIQKITVSVADTVGDVSVVSVTIKSDKKIQTYPMKLITGTGADGTWSGSWTVTDTTIKRYQITLNGTDSLGNASTFDISIR